MQNKPEKQRFRAFQILVIDLTTYLLLMQLHSNSTSSVEVLIRCLLARL